MCALKLDIRLFSSDTTLHALLERTCRKSPIDTILTVEQRACKKKLRNTDIIICDDEHIDLRKLKYLCNETSLFIFLASSDKIASFAESSTCIIDELWPKPLYYHYIESRFNKILTEYYNKQNAQFTRLCLDTVIDTSPDLIWFKDVRGSHLKVNEAFCEAVGKPKAHVEGRGHYYIWDIPPEEYAEGEYVCLETEEIVLARRERCLFDEKVKCKQGMRQFKTYKAPLIDSDGSLLGTVGVAQDMTTQVKTASQLVQSKATFNAATNVAHIHYWKLDLDSQTAWLGPTYAAELGVSKMLADYPECLITEGMIHEESIEPCRNAHLLLKQGQQQVSYDACLLLPNGQECWRRIKYIQQTNSPTSQNMLFGVSENIDDYKQMEKCFSTSAMQNNITSWIYDIEDQTIHSITNAQNTFLIEGQNVGNTIDIFTSSNLLHENDIPSVIEMHKRINRGDPSASVIVRWRPSTEYAWMWLNISYTTIYNKSKHPLRAIGSARDITEQIRAEQLYSTQVEYRNNSTKDALATLLVNLSANKVTEIRGVSVESTSVDSLFETLIAKIPFEGQASATKSFYNREHLMTAFDKGVSHLSIEHLYVPRGSHLGDAPLWVKVTATSIRNPETRDVESFIYLTDINAKKVIELSYKSVLRDYDCLACIDTQHEYITIIHDKYKMLPAVEENSSQLYDTYIFDACGRYVPDTEREAFISVMTLRHVLAQVRQHGVYAAHVRMQDASGLRHKRVQFSSIDEACHHVCMVASDITDIFETEQAKNELLQKALEAAKESSKAKSGFLANMSHEIRTPMNTIIGMSEIMLGKNLPQDLAHDVAAIQSAGNGLLGIINDILDVSKVEAGKFELQDVSYMPASLFMDVCSMISMRLADKPVHFMMNVTPDLPVRLKGDDIRIRQVLINIIGNAIKYTPCGYISLNVDGARLPDGRYRMELQVTDTGIGIKKEDLSRLFVQFNRLDTKKNRHITGTGLGLALSRNFATMMQGDITVSSEYGKGSVFTITLVQQVEEDVPIASVHIQGQKILIYEPDAIIAQAIVGSLEKLGVGYALCSDKQSIPTHQGITHVAVRRKNLESIYHHIQNICYNGNIILLLESSESSDAQYMQYRQLQLPLFCLQIADVLNGENKLADARRPGFDRSQIEQYPLVRVLIVDDNVTNLQVAKGLLAPYHMVIDTALSGRQALDMVHNTHYDLIFMDHMMPEMDGVETTGHIRSLPDSYYHTVPIIALTANAMLGAKEWFLNQGLTDFLAKPIEISKLHRLLRQYAAPIAHARAEQAQQVPTVTPLASERPWDTEPPAAVFRLDMDRARLIYSSPMMYHTILSTYRADMQDRLPALRQMVEEGDLKAFTISVHAIKSASRGACAFALGDAAEALEQLGKKGDLDAVRERFVPFIWELEATTAEVERYLSSLACPEDDTHTKMTRNEFHASDVDRLLAACTNMDYARAEQVLDEMDRAVYPDAYADMLTRMKICCRDFEYEALDELVRTLHATGSM